MIIYDELNDYELVSMAQEQNEDAIELLHKKYQPIIYRKCRKILKYLYSKGIELSDLIQEGNLAVELAIQKFNSNDNVSFYTFVNIFIDRQLMNILNITNRNKHKILNEAMPLENDNNDEVNLIDIIEDNSYSPERKLIIEEHVRELYQDIINDLTDFEWFVFGLKIQGLSYKEIADVLDKDIKSVDNAVQRIKQKVKAILKSKD